MRFFGGLSVEETAAVLKISPQTVMRDCKLARLVADGARPMRGDSDLRLDLFQHASLLWRMGLDGSQSALTRCLADIALFKALGGNWQSVTLPPNGGME